MIAKRTIDHHRNDTAYQRFNKRFALMITKNVGTMTAFWVFAAMALVSLPAAIMSHNIIIIVAWVTQTFLQLVLLPALMVGQNLQSQASDVRIAKQFEDTEKILNMLGEIHARTTES